MECNSLIHVVASTVVLINTLACGTDGVDSLAKHRTCVCRRQRHGGHGTRSTKMHVTSLSRHGTNEDDRPKSGRRSSYASLSHPWLCTQAVNSHADECGGGGEESTNENNYEKCGPEPNAVTGPNGPRGTTATCANSTSSITGASNSGLNTSRA